MAVTSQFPGATPIGSPTGNQSITGKLTAPLPGSDFLNQLGTFQGGPSAGTLSSLTQAGQQPLAANAQSTLDSLLSTGLMSDTAGIEEAAIQQSQQMWGDMMNQINEASSVEGLTGSSAHAGRLATGGSRVASDLAAALASMQYGAQESAAGRRQSAVDQSLGASGLSLEALLGMGGLELGGAGQNLEALLGGGGLELGRLGEETDRLMGAGTLGIQSAPIFGGAGGPGMFSGGGGGGLFSGGGGGGSAVAAAGVPSAYIHPGLTNYQQGGRVNYEDFLSNMLFGQQFNRRPAPRASGAMAARRPAPSRPRPRPQPTSGPRKTDTLSKNRNVSGMQDAMMAMKMLGLMAQATPTQSGFRAGSVQASPLQKGLSIANVSPHLLQMMMGGGGFQEGGAVPDIMGVQGSAMNTLPQLAADVADVTGGAPVNLPTMSAASPRGPQVDEAMNILATILAESEGGAGPLSSPSLERPGDAASSPTSIQGLVQEFFANAAGQQGGGEIQGPEQPPDMVPIMAQGGEGVLTVEIMDELEKSTSDDPLIIEMQALMGFQHGGQIPTTLSPLEEIIAKVQSEGPYSVTGPEGRMSIDLKPREGAPGVVPIFELEGDVPEEAFEGLSAMTGGAGGFIGESTVTTPRESPTERTGRSLDRNRAVTQAQLNRAIRSGNMEQAKLFSDQLIGIMEAEAANVQSGVMQEQIAAQAEADAAIAANKAAEVEAERGLTSSQITANVARARMNDAQAEKFLQDAGKDQELTQMLDFLGQMTQLARAEAAGAAGDAAKDFFKRETGPGFWFFGHTPVKGTSGADKLIEKITARTNSYGANFTAEDIREYLINQTGGPDQVVIPTERLPGGAQGPPGPEPRKTGPVQITPDMTDDEIYKLWDAKQITDDDYFAWLEKS